MTTKTTEIKTLDIKPSPRILQILGDIEFDPWQCIAELVDNAFDDFLDIHRSGQHWPDGFKVSVSLPDKAGADTAIRIEDTGRGMNIDTLNNAVRAGWSSNDRFTKLGLFGMGFNIATARLGRVARIFTTRQQDPEWIGVEIDLDKIGDDFQVPLLTRSKTAPSEHGTIVEVGRLNPSIAGWLVKNPQKLRKTLGNIYAPLLSENPFALYVDQVKVVPRRACVWSDQRSVTYGAGSNAEQIPAIIRFDHALPPADACTICGHFQAPGNAACAECGSEKLQPRARRIHGWLGIQRYLHKTDFGIDFIRNGRKILASNKTALFTWLDPNDPLGTAISEYPVEVGGGRIVGEVHLDHVPVNYQKNAFEWSDRQWISAVKTLRGDGPLLPQEAKRLGYQQNDSHLARLHRGYRRNDPGYRHLIPGNGSTAVHNDTIEWANKFHDGVPEYLTDDKWWSAVVFHEAKAAGVVDPPASDSADVLAELGLDPPNPGAAPPNPGAAPPAKPPTPASPAPKPKPAETEKERAERLKAAGVPIPSLSKDFGIADLGTPLEVNAYGVKEPLVDASGTRAPVWLWRESGKKHLAFVDLAHPLFSTFPLEPAFVLAVEIAQTLKVRAESPLALTEVLAQIVDKNLGDMRVDHSVLSGLARDLLESIKQRMSVAIKANPARAWQHLTPEERAATETSIVVAGAALTLEQAQQSGDFMLHVPGTFVARIIDEWPEAFLDAKVFKGLYTAVTSSAGRQIVVGRLVSYVYDVAVVSEAKARPPLPALARAALSIQLLRAELTSSSEA